MNGYIYITGQGADPGAGKPLKDPMFAPVPSLGACMPNLRRAVSIGDWIFVISGRTQSVSQYVIGGMRVEEKISALEAFRRYPDNHLRLDGAGNLIGNVVVDAHGLKHPLDTHAEDGFDRRIENFIVGGDPIAFDKAREIERSREQTLALLEKLRGKPGNRPIDIIGRMSKLSEPQVQDILDWMSDIKAG